MIQRIYNNKDGWKEARLCPEDLPEESWFKGLLLGPPDLSDLTENFDLNREINNSLVDRGLYTYEDLQGRRAEIIALLKKTNLSVEEQFELRNQIILIYQQDFISRRG